MHISGVWSTSLWYSDLQDEASKLSSLLLSSIMKSLEMIFLQRMLSEERSSHRRQLWPALAISWHGVSWNTILDYLSPYLCIQKEEYFEEKLLWEKLPGAFCVHDDQPEEVSTQVMWSRIKIKVSHSFLYVFQSSSFVSIRIHLNKRMLYISYLYLFYSLSKWINVNSIYICYALSASWLPTVTAHLQGRGRHCSLSGSHISLYCQALVPNPLSPNPLGPAPTQSNPVQRPNQFHGDWGWH